MSNMIEKPLIGAALSLDSLTRYRDWIVADQRDLEIQDFIKTSVLDGDPQPLIDRAKALLDGYTGRLGIHGPFWGLSLDNHDPLIQPIITKRYLQGLEICEKLGATQMVIHSPFSTWDYNNLDNHPGARDQQFERVHVILRDVVARAEVIGAELVIENIEDKDPAQRVALARSFHSKAVRVSIDTGHAHYAHGSTGAPPVDYFVTAAGSMLSHVHLQDADGYADRHWLPGEGTVNWRAVFAALQRIDARPRLVLELRDQTRLMEGVAHLTQTLGIAR